MSAITTHVLDMARGRPATGVPVVLERRLGPDDWEGISRGETDSDGRVRTLLPDAAPLPAGTYRLIFDTRRYFEQQQLRCFFPQVIIVFEAVAGETHYHVPLLLNAFGYTTYRGS
jgi:5-hydroxyisourate hydrolase